MKKFIFLFVIAVSLFAVASCGSGQSSKTDVKSTDSTQVDSVKTSTVDTVIVK